MRGSRFVLLIAVTYVAAFGCDLERIVIAASDSIPDASLNQGDERTGDTTEPEPVAPDASSPSVPNDPELDAGPDPGFATDAGPGSASDAGPFDSLSAFDGPTFPGEWLPDVPPPSGSHQRPPSKRCRSNADCDDISYCQKSECGSTEGTCQHVPLVCGSELKPVCGCDHITYFNDCYRRVFRIEAATESECDPSSGYACGPGIGECPAPSLCALLLPASPATCAHGTQGTCWLVPVICDPQSRDIDRWTPCPAEGIPEGLCVDTCTAIRSAVPHTHVLECP